MSQNVCPDFELESFNCAWCGAFAHQTRFQRVMISEGQMIESPLHRVDGFGVTRCAACKDVSIWHWEYGCYRLAYPSESTAPQAIAGMPEKIRAIFNEAREVLPASPRAAAALLRLGLQVLCVELGLPGKNINEDIGELVKRGLPEKVQKGMDVLRVIGNNAVHPGQIDLNEEQQTAVSLFTLLNICVDTLIVQPSQIDSLFDNLPGGAKNQIAKRDKK